MKRTKVRISDVAGNDILEQADWYKQHSGRALAKRWERALTGAVLRIAKNPHSGSRCNFKEDELRAVRRMPIARFPKHLIFYQVENGEAEILRVIHGARDLESLF
jgi:toxin ParE1/3/4